MLTEVSLLEKGFDCDWNVCSVGFEFAYGVERTAVMAGRGGELSSPGRRQEKPRAKNF